MRFHRTPPLLQNIFSNLTWRIQVNEPVIFLTFDDGPIPEVTDFVLAQLDVFQAKATFFCVGDNVVKHSEIAKRIADKGHRLANHTFHHVNGWKTSFQDYIRNVEQCQVVLKEVVPGFKDKLFLFRPPYGKITRKQATALKANFEIVMWNVLSYDFDSDLPAEQCLQKTIQYTRRGSVVLFHDSLKARRNLEYALPRFLEHFSNLGFTFRSL